MVTSERLRRLMPQLPSARRNVFLPRLLAAMSEFQIDSTVRQAAFLAQLAVESGELRYMEEIANGERYEGRRDLGNTRPGDGRRFKGRGPIQLTGRANYQRYGRALGLDLESHPEMAASPEVGFRIAGLYWHLNGLNALADAGRIDEITRRINGGRNGSARRWEYYRRAMRILSEKGVEGSGDNRSDAGRGRTVSR